MKRLILVLLVALNVEARACDLCAVFTASLAHGEQARGPYAGAGEQLTHFGTLQQSGHETGNAADQFLDSSITQAVIGYNFTQRFGLQVNVPLIYRNFRRPEGDDIVRDSTRGLGDVSLVAKLIAFRKDTPDFTFSAGLIGGVKFPTGSTRRLREETEEEPHEEGAAHGHGDEVESGIHGHDLTLGSGSVDAVIGASVFARWQRVFFSGEIQYAIRQEGDYDYRFANDLTWRFGPGFYALLGHDHSLTLQANVSGDYKEKDKFRGELADDTAITIVYVGPQVAVTYGNRLSLEAGADFPVSVDNSALQIVPDWRIRAGFTWRF